MSSERKKYLFEEVFPSAAKAGRFGAGFKFVRCENNDGEKGEQYASSVVFTNAVMRRDVVSGDDSEINFNLVLKFLPESVKVREIMNSSAQFHNEIVMYSEILPFLNQNGFINNLFPTFYWGNTSTENGKEPIVVIEDLKSKKFSLSIHKLFLDYDHVVLVLQALGKFHAVSYIMKQKNPDKFNKLKDKLVEHVWDRDDDGLSVVSMIGPAALKGVRALRDTQDNECLEKLTRKLESDPLGLMKYFVKPEESIAVICHGDFCNHNLLFNYAECSPNTPKEVTFIDLQTSRYASPVIDLAMILLLNTEYELRKLHWNDFIAAYYNSVKETVTAAGCIPPTFDELQNELRNKLFYGYFHCSYFIPVVVSGERDKVDESVELEPEQAVEQLLSLGGEKAVEIVVSILKHLQELKCFAFLD